MPPQPELTVWPSSQRLPTTLMCASFAALWDLLKPCQGPTRSATSWGSATSRPILAQRPVIAEICSDRLASKGGGARAAAIRIRRFQSPLSDTSSSGFGGGSRPGAKGTSTPDAFQIRLGPPICGADVPQNHARRTVPRVSLDPVDRHVSGSSARGVARPKTVAAQSPH
jgi:hypothetical protein